LIRLHHSDAYLQWLQSYENRIFKNYPHSENDKSTQKIKNVIKVENKKNITTSKQLSFANVTNITTQNLPTHVPQFVNRTPTELLNIDQLNIILHVDVSLYLRINNLSVVPAQSDGHCLMHSWSITTGISMLEIQDIIANEFILHTAFYTTFGISEQDLALYLSSRQHSLQSVDAVIHILCNATNTTAVVIGQQFQFSPDPDDESIIHSNPVPNVTEFRQIKPVSGNSTKHIYLLKTGAHYDAILNKLTQ